MQHQFTSGAYIWAAFVVLAAALLIYLTTRRRREQRKQAQARSTVSASLSERIGPDHPWFGLWSHLFKWRDFSESELQQIVGHCDYILGATAHKEAVLEWERTMFKLVGEDAPATVTKAVELIKREGAKYFEASQEWAKLSHKHFNTMVLADVDKCITSMLDQQARHTAAMEQANQRADDNRRQMVEQSEQATLLRQERDKTYEFALDLRAYLDRSLAIINEQNEQIRQLTPVEMRKYSVRGKDGRFVKAMPTPKAVVQLRDVVKKTRAIGHSTILKSSIEASPTEGTRPDNSEPGEQAQPADMPPVRDWTKPQAFPEGYVVPEGIKVVKIGMDDGWVKKGSIGTTKESDDTPNVKWENSDYDLHGNKHDWSQPNIYLAPLDPRQHPEHPEFKTPNTTS